MTVTIQIKYFIFFSAVNSYIFLSVQHKSVKGYKILERYLKPTTAINHNSPSIIEQAKLLTAPVDSLQRKAVQLFYFVRDQIKYTPYAEYGNFDIYTASYTLKQKSGFCIPKAVLLTALARACSIPARLGFAIIHNYLLSGDLFKLLGTTRIVYHGYCELFIDENWIKATPAFDLEMCEKHSFIPVDFDGSSDAVFHPTNKAGKPHIEYEKIIGVYEDLPFEDIVQTFLKIYG